MNNIHKSPSIVYLIFITVSSFFFVKSLAQDNHYWAQQYGAAGTIMGGAMVAGTDDNSAIYYNPGSLAFIGNTSLSVDANVYRLDKIFILDGAGKGMNLNSAQLSVYPQIISGMLNIFKKSRFRFSYTMLTRNHCNLLMKTRYTSSAAANGDPSAINYAGVFDYINQLTEQWFGAGAGYLISGNLGAGATIFISYRGQSYQLSNNVQEVEADSLKNLLRTKHNDESIRYSNIRLLAKFGLSYSNGAWKTGLTITTPSLGIYSSGDVQKENSAITISDDPAELKNNFLIMDRATGEKSKYRHPFSIAAGVEYRDSKTRLAFSAEYFFKTGTYNLMEPVSNPFVYPASYLDSASYRPLIDSYLHVENAAKPVLNAGIGLSRNILKNLDLLLGASTDFSSFQHPDETNEMFNAFGEFDIYHFSAGLQYHQSKHSFTVGFSYAYTPSKNVPPYTTIKPSPGSTGQAILSAHSNAVILGYTYYFSRTGE